MSKKLVAYFSASGVTAAAAKKVAEASGADLKQERMFCIFKNLQVGSIPFGKRSMECVRII